LVNENKIVKIKWNLEMPEDEPAITYSNCEMTQLLLPLFSTSVGNFRLNNGDVFFLTLR